MVAASYEFHASRWKTLPLFAGLLVTAGVSAGLVRLAGEAWLLAGILSLAALITGAGALVLAYRLVMRPVMLRVDEDGVFFKRLAVTVPWEAIARVETVAFKDRQVFSLVRADGEHAVYLERGVMIGSALNEKLGLPPLAITMDDLVGSEEDFAAAVEVIGRVPVVRPPAAG